MKTTIRNSKNSKISKKINKSDKSKKNKKAVILFSGGLDSTVCLYWAMNKGYKCEVLTINYGQRHKREIQSARKIAEKVNVKMHNIKLDFPWLEASSLVDKSKKLPVCSYEKIGDKIPSTYVPARNLMFTSIAVSLAESIGAEAVILGPNALDFSGYPDCRPQFYKELSKAVLQGCGRQVKLITPIIKLSKQEIVKLGRRLKAPLELTWSCYAGGKEPCGVCDSCKLREKAFAFFDKK